MMKYGYTVTPGA